MAVAGTEHAVHATGDDRATASPALTVCVPTFRRSERLRAALTSLQRQTYRDLVVDVCDNGADDETAQVVWNLGDERFRYVPRPVNVGAVANANLALAAVRTEYALLLHDDDEVEPGFLSAAVAALDRHPGAALALAPWWVVREDGERELLNRTGWTDQRCVAGGTLVSRWMSFMGVAGHVSGTVMRTAALPEPAFDPRDDFADDLGLQIRMALEHDVVFLPVPAATVTQWEGTHSSEVDYGLAGDLVRRDVRVRVLDGPAAGRPESAAWRAQVDATFRRRLLWYAGAAARERRSPRAAVDVVRQGRQADPRLLADPRAWPALFTGAIGSPAPRSLARSLRRPREWSAGRHWHQHTRRHDEGPR
jgi:glycosyltransferase involved in cell wall biosynthesis